MNKTHHPIHQPTDLHTNIRCERGISRTISTSCLFCNSTDRSKDITEKNLLPAYCRDRNGKKKDPLQFLARCGLLCPANHTRYSAVALKTKRYRDALKLFSAAEEALLNKFGLQSDLLLPVAAIIEQLACTFCQLERAHNLGEDIQAILHKACDNRSDPYSSPNPTANTLNAQATKQATEETAHVPRNTRTRNSADKIRRSESAGRRFALGNAGVQGMVPAGSSGK